MNELTITVAILDLNGHQTFEDIPQSLFLPLARHYGEQGCVVTQVSGADSESPTHRHLPAVRRHRARRTGMGNHTPVHPLSVA